jgi:hypothetical protein
MKLRYPVRWLLWGAVIVAAVSAAAPYVPVPYIENPALLYGLVAAAAFLAVWLWSLVNRAD